MSLFESSRPDLEVARARMLLAAGVEWAQEATRVRPWVVGSLVHLPSCPAARGDRFLFSVVDLAPLSRACSACFPSEWRTWHEETDAAAPCLPALALADALSSSPAPSWDTLLAAVRHADRLLAPSLTGPVPAELSAHLHSEGERLLALVAQRAPQDDLSLTRATRALELLSLRGAGVLGEAPDPPAAYVLSSLRGEEPPAPSSSLVRPTRRDPVLLALEEASDWTGVLTPLVLLSCPVLARVGTRRLVVVPRHVAELRSSRSRYRASWCELPLGVDPAPPEVWDTTLSLWAPRSGPEDLLSQLEGALAAARSLHGSPA